MMERNEHLTLTGLDAIRKIHQKSLISQIESSHNGNIDSEIPCHLIGGLHEWRNDSPAVSNVDPVKLKCP